MYKAVKKLPFQFDILIQKFGSNGAFLLIFFWWGQSEVRKCGTPSISKTCKFHQLFFILNAFKCHNIIHSLSILH